MNTRFRYYCTPIINLALSLSLLCFAGKQCLAQNDSGTGKSAFFVGKHRIKYSFPPKALLIQLRSEKNRIQYFESHNDLENTLRIKKEAARVRQVMINDFRDHFSFCPVYYFIDTNANLIKQQKFDGILFDAFDNPVNKPVISASDTEYYIVFYGYPENEKTEAFVTREAKYTNGTGNVMGRGLVFLNYKYEQRDYIPVFHRPLIDNDKLYGPEYYFFSKKFDIEYTPRAELYYGGLVKRFGQNNKTPHTTN